MRQATPKAQAAECPQGFAIWPFGDDEIVGRWGESSTGSSAAAQPRPERRMRFQIWALNPKKQWRPQPASHCWQDAGTPRRVRGRSYSRPDALATMPTLPQSVLPWGTGRTEQRTRHGSEGSRLSSRLELFCTNSLTSDGFFLRDPGAEPFHAPVIVVSDIFHRQAGLVRDFPERVIFQKMEFQGLPLLRGEFPPKTVQHYRAGEAR